MNFERWSRACGALGIPSLERDYREVRRAWRSLGRHYHSLAHLDACLREFEAVRGLAQRPGEAEMALWFHDAVYRSWRNDNEARSAALAAKLLRAAPGDCIERIRMMIMATVHRGAAPGGDAALVVDVDLSILGQPPEVYAGFEKAVRREYWWVPRARYVKARGAVLRSFLQRPAIYHHEILREKYEQPARLNLAQAIENLQAG